MIHVTMFGFCLRNPEIYEKEIWTAVLSGHKSETEYPINPLKVLNQMKLKRILTAVLFIRYTTNLHNLRERIFSIQEIRGDQIQESM